MSSHAPAITGPWHDQAVTDTYEDVKMLIYKMSHKYAARHRVAFEDILSEAHRTFMRCFYNYNPTRFQTKAKFSSYLYFALSCELSTHLKKEHRHRGHLEIKEELVGAAEHDANFRVMLESELSEDAKAVVALLLDTPSDMAVLFKWHDVRGKRGCLVALRDHLEDIGWGAKRISESFNEIKSIFAN